MIETSALLVQQTEQISQTETGHKKDRTREPEASPESLDRRLASDFGSTQQGPDTEDRSPHPAPGRGQSDLEADGGQLHRLCDSDGVDFTKGYTVFILREALPVDHHLPRSEQTPVVVPGQVGAHPTPASRSFDLCL